MAKLIFLFDLWPYCHLMLRDNEVEGMTRNRKLMPIDSYIWKASGNMSNKR